MGACRVVWLGPSSSTASNEVALSVSRSKREKQYSLFFFCRWLPLKGQANVFLGGCDGSNYPLLGDYYSWAPHHQMSRCHAWHPSQPVIKEKRGLSKTWLIHLCNLHRAFNMMGIGGGGDYYFLQNRKTLPEITWPIIWWQCFVHVIQFKSERGHFESVFKMYFTSDVMPRNVSHSAFNRLTQLL